MDVDGDGENNIAEAVMSDDGLDDVNVSSSISEFAITEVEVLSEETPVNDEIKLDAENHMEESGTDVKWPNMNEIGNIIVDENTVITTASVHGE